MTDYPATDYRTVVLNGSPHREKSHGAAMAEYLTHLLPGHSVRLDLYDFRVWPCLGCIACENGNECFMDDEMGRILHMLENTDCVLMASPLHFLSLSAPLVAFISRLQQLWMYRRAMGKSVFPPRRRVGALLLTGGGRYKGMFEPARAVAGAAFRALDMPMLGVVSVADTDSIPVMANKHMLIELRELATRILAATDHPPMPHHSES